MSPREVTPEMREQLRRANERQAWLRANDPEWAQAEKERGRAKAAVSNALLADDPERLQKLLEAGEKGREEAARLRATDPEYAARERERARKLAEHNRGRGAAAVRRRMEADPVYAEAVREQLREAGLLGSAAVAQRAAEDPEFTMRLREAQAESGRRSATAMAKMRRRCVTCGMVSHPGALGRHIKERGHEGWEAVQP